MVAPVAFAAASKSWASTKCMAKIPCLLSWSQIRSSILDRQIKTLAPDIFTISTKRVRIRASSDLNNWICPWLVMFNLTENGPSSFAFSSRRLISSLVRKAILGVSSQLGILGWALPFLIMTPRTSLESLVWPPGCFTTRTLSTSIIPSSATRLMASDRSRRNHRLRSSLPQSTTSRRCSSMSFATFLAISFMISPDFSGESAELQEGSAEPLPSWLTEHVAASHHGLMDLCCTIRPAQTRIEFAFHLKRDNRHLHTHHIHIVRFKIKRVSPIPVAHLDL